MSLQLSYTADNPYCGVAPQTMELTAKGESPLRIVSDSEEVQVSPFN